MPFFVVHAIDGITDNGQRMIGALISNVVGGTAGDGAERIAMRILAALGRHTANVNLISTTTMLRVATAMDDIARQMIFHTSKHLVIIFRGRF